MTTIDLRKKSISLDELLRMAERHAIEILTPNGHAFIIEERDMDFEREIEELSNDESFVRFLNERNQEPGTFSLDEIEELIKG